MLQDIELADPGAIGWNQELEVEVEIMRGQV
jgi:hypothetical protein